MSDYLTLVYRRALQSGDPGLLQVSFAAAVLEKYRGSAAYSVIRTWCESDLRFNGWYVNLESPWVRTTVGFDSRDDILDVF